MSAGKIAGALAGIAIAGVGIGTIILYVLGAVVLGAIAWYLYKYFTEDNGDISLKLQGLPRHAYDTGMGHASTAREHVRSVTGFGGVQHSGY